ncbi:MAG: hypothetical protein ACJ76N_12535 [Thermoanaerobaculia bacterium]
MLKEEAMPENDDEYQVLLSHPEMDEELFRDFVREQELERAELRRAVAHYLLESLRPLQIPGKIEIPEIAELEEVQSMLTEHVAEWTEQWKQEGREDCLGQARGVLSQYLERRFGPLPEEIRRRIETIASISEMTELSIRAGEASSLAVLMSPAL